MNEEKCKAKYTCLSLLTKIQNIEKENREFEKELEKYKQKNQELKETLYLLKNSCVSCGEPILADTENWGPLCYEHYKEFLNDQKNTSELVDQKRVRND